MSQLPTVNEPVPAASYEHWAPQRFASIERFAVLCNYEEMPSIGEKRGRLVGIGFVIRRLVDASSWGGLSPQGHRVVETFVVRGFGHKTRIAQCLARY